jgi:penicillin-binding protein 2
MRGKAYTPHFLKEFRPIAAMGEEGGPSYFPARAGFTFQHPEPHIIQLEEKQWDLVLKGMWGVVNGGGTAGSVRMPELEIAGKTGTAQVASLGKDVGKNKDHAWFDSFAPWDKPEIAVVSLIENSGFGAANAGPAARGIYATWYAKKHGIVPNGQEVARK